MSSWVLFAGVFALAWTLAWLQLRVLRGRLVDSPGERSSHTRPTPTGGGLALVVALVCSVLFATAPGTEWRLVVTLAALLAAVGLVDDWRGLGVLPRLGAQFGAATALVVLVGPDAIRVGSSGVAVMALAVLAMVWLINAYNFMDGIDGLAGGHALFMTLGAAWLAQRAGGGPDTVDALLCAAAACAGFLAWNWPPARLFMGDTGSQALGFLLGAAVLVTAWRGELPPAVWVILWAPFLCDTGLTLLARALRRERLHLAHRGHAYQRLARRWRSHRRVTLAVLVVDYVWLLPLALLVTIYPQWASVLVCLALAPLLVVVRSVLYAPEIDGSTGAG